MMKKRCGIHKEESVGVGGFFSLKLAASRLAASVAIETFSVIV